MVPLNSFLDTLYVPEPPDADVVSDDCAVAELLVRLVPHHLQLRSRHRTDKKPFTKKNQIFTVESCGTGIPNIRLVLNGDI